MDESVLASEDESVLWGYSGDERFGIDHKKNKVARNGW